jgi:hypothetical protein
MVFCSSILSSGAVFETIVAFLRCQFESRLYLRSCDPWWINPYILHINTFKLQRDGTSKSSYSRWLRQEELLNYLDHCFVKKLLSNIDHVFGFRILRVLQNLRINIFPITIHFPLLLYQVHETVEKEFTWYRNCTECLRKKMNQNIRIFTKM